MNVLIFGAGALGSLMGALLSGRHEITLVGRKAHMDAVKKDGLRIEGIRKAHVHPEAKTAITGDESPDLVIVAVKAYDTEKAAKELSAVVGATTIVCTVQNGLGNFEILKAAFPSSPILAATMVMGAMLESPGIVRYAGQGKTALGGTPKELSAASVVGRMFREAGINALGVPEIKGHLWQKAIVNAAFNPLSALLNKTNGQLLDDPKAMERMRLVSDEGAAVARGLRVPLPERDVFAVVERVGAATMDNKSSMQQDIAKGRRTEIDSINGVIVREGAKLKIPTPENQALIDEIKALEKKR